MALEAPDRQDGHKHVTLEVLDRQSDVFSRVRRTSRCKSDVFLRSNPPPGAAPEAGSWPALRGDPVVGPRPLQTPYEIGLPAIGFRGCPKPAPGPAPLPPFPPGSPAPAPPGLGGQGHRPNPSTPPPPSLLSVHRTGVWVYIRVRGVNFACEVPRMVWNQARKN